MKLLAAVDLSRATAPVIETCRRIAQLTEAEVVLLHVAEPDPEVVDGDSGLEVVRDQVANEYREEHRQLQSLARKLVDDGVAATALLIQGPTVETVLSETARVGAELIVVGSHGHGALYDILIGSISAGVLRKSSIPVVVVPTRGL